MEDLQWEALDDGTGYKCYAGDYVLVAKLDDREYGWWGIYEDGEEGTILEGKSEDVEEAQADAEVAYYNQVLI